MRLKCKKSVYGWYILTENKYYNFKIEPDFLGYHFYIFINDNGNKRVCNDDPVSPYYIYDYFYTKEELRTMKIKELLNETEM
jgi:hypothetical protein